MTGTGAELEVIWKGLVEDSAHGGTVMRRILPDSGHDCFLVLDHRSGERSLRISANDQHPAIHSIPPNAEGFRVERRQAGADTVVVTLTDAAVLDPFLSLVEDLVQVAGEAPKARTVSAVMARISAWLGFFQSKGLGLGKEGAAGLFAELTVLQSVVAALGPDAGVDAWTGPDKSRQDFVFPDAALEVKSWRGTGHARPTITSEHQLDTEATGALRLAVVTLDQRLSGPGTQISNLIDELRATLGSSPAAVISFNTKLVAYGWAGNVPEHRTEVYTVLLREDFEVRSNFPRLVPTLLPNGVSHVSYRVDRSAISEFLIDDHDLGKWLAQ